jgi:hypothetical protein
MFDKLFKTKPYLIYLFTILVVLVIIYFGYPYLVKKDGFTADDEDDEDDDEVKQEGFTDDDEDDDEDEKPIKKPVENMRDSGMVNGDPAYKKKKISSIVPFPTPSSVGPTNPGVSVDNTTSNNKNTVKTYNF